MRLNKLKIILATCIAVSLSACNDNAKNAQRILNVDIGAEVAAVDPAMIEDGNSERVGYDLFSALVSFDQAGNLIPGLAESWDISPDNKVYTFHLRDNLRFSDNSPITANDVVFSWRRIADPKTGSPYSMYMAKLKNGNDIISGKLPVDKLGIKAIDDKTVEVELINPEPAFISMCSLVNLSIVSEKNIIAFGKSWIDPKNMVTSGAYTIKSWVTNGYMLVNKNPYYYDAKNVKIENVKFFPIVDANDSLNHYKTGDIDITWSIPTNQYNSIKEQFGNQLHTNLAEAMIYLDLNMKLAKYADAPKLRQALSMAVDREALTKEVLGQGQKPLYSFVTPTIENGKFANLNYEWSKWSRESQNDNARNMLQKAGYNQQHPLEVNILYGNSEINKKVVLSVASMWQNVFGNSVIVKTTTNDWKSFLAARKAGNYDVERTGWLPSYNYVDNYLVLFTCNSPQNTSHYCNPKLDKMLENAKLATPDERVKIINNALVMAQNDYFIVPLFQNTKSQLVNPNLKGYSEKHNHLGLEQSKWYNF